METTVKWVPVTTRPLTPEEIEMYGDIDFIYDCQLPDECMDVLVTLTDGTVTTASFDLTYGGDFDGFDDKVIAWAHLPEAYKKEGKK